MPDEDIDGSSKVQAYAILAAVAAFAVAAYVVNNAYETWTLTASPVFAFLAYYYGSQPIYIGFLLLFTYEVYRQDESGISALRGFLAANMAMISLDIMGLPYAVQSVLNLHGTTQVQYNPGLAPFADWILVNYAVGSSGIVNFWVDAGVHIFLPIGLIFGAFLVARPGMFVEIVERS